MNILLFPWAKPLRNGKKHPKNYPWWPELISKLQEKGHNLTQVGVNTEIQLVSNFITNLNLEELENVIKQHDVWIGVDSFAQHFCWDIGKRGIAIFGQSDPIIFGHKENINILKDRSYLRKHQFWLWEQAECIDEAFVEPDKIIKTLEANFK